MRSNPYELDTSKREDELEEQLLDTRADAEVLANILLDVVTYKHLESILGEHTFNLVLKYGDK